MALMRGRSHEGFGVLLVLALTIQGLNCCESRKKLQPELLFPGLSEWDAESIGKDNRDAMSAVLNIGGTSLTLFPGVNYFGGILIGVSTIINLYSDASSKFADMADRKIGVEALVNVVEDVSAIGERIKDIRDGRLADVNLGIAWNECTKVLNKYKNRNSGLFKGSNHILSSTSLIAFIRVYTGVALMRANRLPDPDSTRQVKEGLEELRATVIMYRDAFVETRLSYFVEKQPGPYLAAHGFPSECIDKYQYYVPHCKSCKDYDCYEKNEWDGWNYHQEVARMYNNYFNDAANSIGDVIWKLRSKYNW